VRRVIVLAALTTCGPTASGRDDFGNGRLTRNQTLALAWHFAQWRSAGDPATELLRRSARVRVGKSCCHWHCSAPSSCFIRPPPRRSPSLSRPARGQCCRHGAAAGGQCPTILAMPAWGACQLGLAAHWQPEAGIARGRPAWQATGSARRRRLVGIGLPTCRGVTGQLSVTPSLRSNQRTWPQRRVRIQGPGRDSESD
jgi:hypothetical protein